MQGKEKWARVRDTNGAQGDRNPAALSKQKQEGVMKMRFFPVAAAIVLTVLSTSGVAQAQDLLVVNVPFDFIAGKATLPAGAYSVQPLSRGPVVLLKKIGQPAAGAVAMTIPAQPKLEQSKSVLVFRRYGEDYFLTQIWNAQDKSCRALTFKPSRARERELAKSDRPEQITLVAYSAPAK